MGDFLINQVWGGAMIFAVDPGNIQSAFVLLHPDLSVEDKGIVPNSELLKIIPRHSRPSFKDSEFVIEMMASYGMAIGREVFETVFWIGRFYEGAKGYASRNLLYRMDVKMNLCKSMRAKDSNIRRALIDRFGEVGTKKSPGWFYGIKADLWQSYALGVTYSDLKVKRENRESEI